MLEIDPEPFAKPRDVVFYHYNSAIYVRFQTFFGLIGSSAGKRCSVTNEARFTGKCSPITQMPQFCHGRDRKVMHAQIVETGKLPE